MFFSVMLRFFTSRSKTQGIREGDGTDKANSGYFAPRRDTLKRRPCLGRDKPLATAAPIEGVKGGGGGWTSVCVWVSGEQQRAARTRRPFAYFTGNLRASIRQGNCKNGGVIYLSLPLWALSSFPRFPFPSALLLAHVCADTHRYLYAHEPCTYSKEEGNTSAFSVQIKRICPPVSTRYLLIVLSYKIRTDLVRSRVFLNRYSLFTCFVKIKKKKSFSYKIIHITDKQVN